MKIIPNKIDVYRKMSRETEFLGSDASHMVNPENLEEIVRSLQ